MDELIKNVIISNELGLHARSAAKLAILAGKAAAGIWIVKGDEEADATSVIDVLTLACPKGTRVSVRIEDNKDSGVLNDMIELIENGFEE